MIVGITGRVGVGKSKAVEIIQTTFKDVSIFDLDLIGHELLLTNKLKQQCVDLFSKKILDQNKEIDRSILSQIVFADQEKLKQLNRIIHPEICSYVKNKIIECKQENNLIIIAGALILEIGLVDSCDKVITIDANNQKIIQKIGQKYAKIAKHQRSKEEYNDNSDKVIINNFDLEFSKDIVNAINQYNK